MLCMLVYLRSHALSTLAVESATTELSSEVASSTTIRLGDRFLLGSRMAVAASFFLQRVQNTKNGIPNSSSGRDRVQEQPVRGGRGLRSVRLLACGVLTNRPRRILALLWLLLGK